MAVTSYFNCYSGCCEPMRRDAGDGCACVVDLLRDSCIFGGWLHASSASGYTSGQPGQVCGNGWSRSSDISTSTRGPSLGSRNHAQLLRLYPRTQVLAAGQKVHHLQVLLLRPSRLQVKEHLKDYLRRGPPTLHQVDMEVRVFLPPPRLQVKAHMEYHLRHRLPTLHLVDMEVQVFRPPPRLQVKSQTEDHIRHRRHTLHLVELELLLLLRSPHKAQAQMEDRTQLPRN
ncbi:hypothetical protein MPTK1_2g09290 [Marchantia polymorpha subsp. ruderalis]|uniref:Uncharacterized protein n=1 Tax=Marchantia polymorpha TaxID=3197 RepID=A0A2R6XH51_MARPO|nr:hypothetical protein MARPO_0015s0209 [Marchantia polymorpha]BBN01665.1 hypothetical protein Mp_2g09290 [Marchantia polymorpha subsp. ruderalis]|eukprot:PTQ45430.1 hypothetical protein MARPO_0015s0209 [Marchantia polymorpha]